ncbi:MAG: hypothetical protein WA885_23190 [Phormidesmis sp.]
MSLFKSLIVDKFLSVWWAVVILLLALPFAVWLFNVRAVPDQAQACRSFNGHEVCAISLRRSAARYWEYRTVVDIDGKRQPLELYNCRDRTRTLAKDGTRIAFLSDKVGDWICSLTQPVRSSNLDERVTIKMR